MPTILLRGEDSSVELASSGTRPEGVFSPLSLGEGVHNRGRCSRFSGFSCRDVSDDNAGVDDCFSITE